MLNDIIYSQEAQNLFQNQMKQKYQNDMLGMGEKNNDKKKLIININKDELNKQNI